jgi:hypothetical protein
MSIRVLAGRRPGPRARELNEPFAVESCDAALAKTVFGSFEGGGFGAARGLAYVAHVVDMEVYELAEGLKAR